MLNFILHHLSEINQICQALAALLAIAHWIRQLRKEKLGFTQEKFAEVLNVEVRTVQRWESGDRQPSQDSMVKMRDMVNLHHMESLYGKLMLLEIKEQMEMSLAIIEIRAIRQEIYIDRQKKYMENTMREFRDQVWQIEAKLSLLEIKVNRM